MRVQGPTDPFKSADGYLQVADAPSEKGVNEYLRLKTLIARGDELRNSIGPEALALLAASHISATRPNEGPGSFPGKALILRQLKHPEEVYRLRSIYGDGFHVIGLYCPVRERRRALRSAGLSEEEVDELIAQDEYERAEFGQRFRDTFHLSDVFIATSASEDGIDRTTLQITLAVIFVPNRKSGYHDNEPFVGSVGLPALFLNVIGGHGGRVRLRKICASSKGMPSASPKTSEYLTRKQIIDAKLRAAGWRISRFDPDRPLDAFDRCAIEEFPTNNGPADYALCIQGQIVGVVEAKKLTLGPQEVLPLAERYSRGLAVPTGNSI